jgi:ribosomal protein S18 acetylase RimI-like enzyme
MSPYRYSWRMAFELAAPVPQPQLPQGVQIRTLRYPDDLEVVFRAQDEAFQENYGYKGVFEEDFPRWKNFTFAAMKLKPELWFLAVEGDIIAGSINAQERSDLDANIGWISTLFEFKPFRRRGLGQALLQHAFRVLQERGVQGVGLDVDAKNKTGATRLYQRVGMHVTQ